MKRGEYRAKEKQKVATEVAKIPHDPYNEQVVIAAACVDRKARSLLVQQVQADCFFAKGHAKFWELLKQLEQKQLDYDLLTMQSLAGDTDLDLEGYFDQLIRQRPKVPTNLAFHVQSLMHDRTRIEAARGPVSALLEALKDTTTEPSTLRALARNVGGSFEQGSLEYLRDSQQLVHSVVSDYDKRKTGQHAWPVGLDGFDIYGPEEELAGQHRVLPGLAPKHISLVTGLPGSGKSTTVCGILVAQANAKRRILYGAWEMTSETSLELCASVSLGLSRTDVLTATLRPEDERALKEEVERLSQYIRFFELPFGRKQGEKQLNDRNLDLIHSYVVSSGCEIFVADLWRKAIRQFDPDEEEEALNRQQAIARETNTHTMMVHQQRLKDVEQRADKRPTREGLKGSGAWTEVADLILGVHNPALFKNVPNDVLEVIILKQRYGRWPLAVEFDYDPVVGSLLNGRSIDVTQQGEESQLDAFLKDDKKKGGNGGRRKKF